MRRLVKVVALCFVGLLCGYGYFFYQNNRAAPAVGQERIAQSYESGVAWLLSHREKILHDGNPMLWWMLGESARVSGDIRVQSLFNEFRDNFDHVAPNDMWQAFFHPQQFRNATFSASEYNSLVDYQKYFLFALTCSVQLAQEPSIVIQNQPNFCWRGSRIVRPACVTHQLMGYRMAQRNHCAINNLDENIAVSKKTIERQLRYDPRVVDVYIQRVLMSVEVGADTSVKPRWLERVLEAQLADGGWFDVQPLVPIGNGKYFGFTSTAVAIVEPASNFHATAQGVLLMSLLMHPQNSH